MTRRTPSLSPSYSIVQIAVGLAVGLFAFGAFVHRPRRRLRPAPAPVERAPTASILSVPSAVLLASVAGEEDPGAAVDAPAPAPAPEPDSSTSSPPGI